MKPSETVTSPSPLTFLLGRTAPWLHSQDKQTPSRHMWMKAKLKGLGGNHCSAHVPWHQHHHVVFLIHAVPPNVHIIPWVHRVLKRRRGGRIRALSHVDVIKAKPEVTILTGKWVTQWRTSEPLTTSLSITSSLITRASHFFLYSVSSYRKSKDHEDPRDPKQSYRRRLLQMSGPLTQEPSSETVIWAKKQCPSVKTQLCLLLMSPLIKSLPVGQSHYF